MSIIEMRDVVKKYDNGTTALRGVTVTIEPGEFAYIVGPSGAGKSTFIRSLYREVKVEKGSLTVAGFNLVKIKKRDIPLLRRNVGVVFQDYKLLPKKTVYENIAYAMEVIGENRRNIKKRVMEVLDLVGLKHKVRSFPNELSGGEQQRIAIARAIVNNPKVLIADEPTGNLDPDNSWEIMNLLERINLQGTTVLMATHNSQIVNTLRHRVIAIENTMISRFFRHLFESLKSLKRNGWMTVAAVSSVMITLTLVALFASVIFNTAKLATDIENNVRVMVYIRKDVADNSETIEKEGQTVTNNDYHKVYDALKAMPAVKSVTFSSKEEQYQKLTETMGDDWKVFEGDANPLYDAYIVDTNSPSDVKTVAEEAKKIEGVSEVQDGGANTQRLFELASFIRVWGLVIAGLLIFIAVFLISNTIRITIISRSREIQIMRLVGAKNGYIRGPFLLEGAFIGLFGAAIPSVLVFFVYNMVYQSVNKSLVGQNLSMIAPDVFIPLMTLLLFVIGIFIGSLGSGISMRRFLKI